MPVIDAHQHFWKPARGDYGWMSPDDAVLYRDYLPADLAPELKAAGVDYTVTVQAADTEDETRFMLSLAEETDFIAGVVGWVDMERSDFPDRLAALAEHAKFKGIRPMLQDLEDDAYILRPTVLANLKHLAETGLAFDFLTFPRHLPHVLKALEEVPELRAVIDHVSKPAIAAGTLDPWRSLMAEIAAHEGVHCKVSGMVTEADHARWMPDDLAPYVDHVVECFGPDRLIYGSDWPVALLAAPYERVIGTARALLGARLDADGMGKAFGENAARFYRLAV
ncbi:amidohydrolase [Arsenicitalea aurantiaca]|uniref:Amidohydrolase n=1 Tax=Arsenicitalea aurantiaca TaxID=1783274 RepID=A0A433XLC7_9HYPH|nr:amidohydrolase family protein [Arsenicitalea aurantiaca]RUT34880.1 amidohydrolase [Arsenicitalea aurantiaca]